MKEDDWPSRAVYNSSVRRLIINADDFGLTNGVNRAILEAHRDGIVTSTTLMANSAAFDDAVRLAKTRPVLGIGCHVLLVDGSPLSDGSSISTLLQRVDGSALRFRENLGAFITSALLRRIDSQQIEAEVAAQIRRLQSADIPLTHIDTHKHTHMFPIVLQPVLRAARKCGVRAIRNPFSPSLFIFSRLKRRPGLWKRSVQLSVLQSLSNNFRTSVRDAGLVTPDGTLGILETGWLDQELLLSTIETMPEGTWELVCHPGYNDSDLDSVKTRLRESRVEELKILTSPATRDALAKREIALISYRDFAES